MTRDHEVDLVDMEADSKHHSASDTPSNPESRKEVKKVASRLISIPHVRGRDPTPRRIVSSSSEDDGEFKIEIESGRGEGDKNKDTETTDTLSFKKNESAGEDIYRLPSSRQKSLSDPEELLRLSKTLRDNFERSVCESISPELSERVVVWPFGKRAEENNMTIDDGITFAPRRPRNLADEFASMANQKGKERASGIGEERTENPKRPLPPSRRSTGFSRSGLGMPSDSEEEVEESPPNDPSNDPLFSTNPSPLSPPTSAEASLPNSPPTSKSKSKPKSPQQQSTPLPPQDLTTLLTTLQQSLTLIRSQMDTMSVQITQNINSQLIDLYASSPSSAIQIADLSSLPDLHFRENSFAPTAVLKTAMVCGILERGLEALIDVVNDRGVSSEIEKVLGEGEREEGNGKGKGKEGNREGLFEVCQKRPKRVAKSMKDALRDMEDVLKHDKKLSKGRSTTFY